MIVGVARFRLRLRGVRSLKEKRGQLRTVLDRLRQRFDLSVAEVGALDAHGWAEVGLAVVSNERAHAERMLQRVLDAAEAFGVGTVEDVRTELLHLGHLPGSLGRTEPARDEASAFGSWAAFDAREEAP